MIYIKEVYTAECDFCHKSFGDFHIDRLTLSDVLEKREWVSLKYVDERTGDNYYYLCCAKCKKRYSTQDLYGRICGSQR